MKEKSIFSKANGAGKGDEPRIGISQKKWEERWEKIFRHKGASKDIFKDKKWGSHYSKIAPGSQMEQKKHDKVWAVILSMERKVLRNIIKRNIEDKVNEQYRVKESQSNGCYWFNDT